MLAEIHPLIDDLYTSTIAGTGGLQGDDDKENLKTIFDDIHKKIDGVKNLSQKQFNRWKIDIQKLKSGIKKYDLRFRHYKVDNQELSRDEIWVFLVQSYNSMTNGSPEQMLTLSLDEKKIALKRMCQNMKTKISSLQVKFIYYNEVDAVLKIINDATTISEQQYKDLSQTLNKYLKNMTFQRGNVLEGSQRLIIVFYNGAFGSYVTFDQLKVDIKKILQITTGGKKRNSRKTKNTGKKAQRKNAYTQRNKNKN